MQKKLKLSVMTLAMLLILSITASAMTIQPRWDVTTKCNLGLSFDGTTATCTANIAALSGADISGTMTLYRVSGSNEYEVKNWSLSGTTRLIKSGTCTVTRGETYKLVVDVTVSGSGGSDNINLDTTEVCK